MHTTVETVHKKDVGSIINWMLQFLIQLPAGHSFDYVY